MDATISATSLITCARPQCAARNPVGESIYVDGASQLCIACAGPLPEWAHDIERPY
jgi:hypothetical protein